MLRQPQGTRTRIAAFQSPVHQAHSYRALDCLQRNGREKPNPFRTPSSSSRMSKARTHVPTPAFGMLWRCKYDK